MTILRPAAWHPAPPRTQPTASPVRRFLAATLRGASLTLERLAQRLAEAPAAPFPPLPALAESLEFHADTRTDDALTDALGGALYLDGQLVGYLPHVRRL